MKPKGVLGVAAGGVTIAMIVALYVSAGGNINDVYYCPLDGKVAAFEGGLSASMQRGYPTKGSTAGYIDCVSPNKIRGEWVSCKNNPICQNPVPKTCLLVKVQSNGAMECMRT